MPIEVFFVEGHGPNATAAFRSAKWEAARNGPLAFAEKGVFMFVEVPDGLDPRGYAEKLIADSDGRFCRPAGPAGCVRLEDKTFLFFGWGDHS